MEIFCFVLPRPFISGTLSVVEMGAPGSISPAAPAVDFTSVCQRAESFAEWSSRRPGNVLNLVRSLRIVYSRLSVTRYSSVFGTCGYQDSLYSPYFEKSATNRFGGDAAWARTSDGRNGIDITAPPEENVRLVAKAKGVGPEEICVTILDRERHAEIIQRVRQVGARVHLITDGDVAGAVSAATTRRSGVDLLLGIGGTPEGVIAAAALKCLGGEIQGRLYPRNDEERRALIDDGYDLDAVLTADDLAAGDDLFFAATGITDGYLLDGVKYWPDAATTYSMVMRSR